MLPWVEGPKPAQSPLPEPAQQGRQWYYGNGGIRYLIARDPSYNTLGYLPDKFRDRVLEISNLMDSTNPDLTAFERHGGKLILKENAHDFAKSGNDHVTRSRRAGAGAEPLDRIGRVSFPDVNRNEGIVRSKPSQQVDSEHVAEKRRHGDAHAADRHAAERGDLGSRLRQVAQDRPAMLEQALSSFRELNTAAMSVE